MKLQENDLIRANPGEEGVPDIRTRLRDGFRSGIETALKLIKWVLPLYVVVDLLKDSPLLVALGKVFAPIMTLFGLPGEAAFAFVAAFLVNLYAAIAILAPLDLTPWQVTQCGIMMGIAHNLLLEGAVLGSTGVRPGLITLCRLAIAVLAGLIMQGLALLGVG